MASMKEIIIAFRIQKIRSGFVLNVLTINDTLPLGKTSSLSYSSILFPPPPKKKKKFLSQLNSLSITNSDELDSGRINCKYYDSYEFRDKKIDSSCFSLFHMNISSLSKHFDELHALIGDLKHNFSVIGICETGFNSSTAPINCDLEGFSYKHTPTLGTKGGALLYISNKFSFMERLDLDKLCYRLIVNWSQSLLN